MAGTELKVHKVDLHPPSLDDLAVAIRSGLRAGFQSASAEILTPPDLRQSPFYLAAPGLSGHPRIADIGGQPNLMPSPNLNAKYDLLAISELMEMPREGGALIGAGAGPFHVLGRNTELMPNLAYGSAAAGKVHNCTHYAKITNDGSVCCEPIGQSTGFGLMCNLLGSDGLPGPLLHLRAKGRTGKANFTEAIQSAIGAVYGEKLVSLGGVFVIHAGKTNLHVMPDFPDKPFKSRDDVESWLKYFDTEAPLVCLSVLHTGDDQGMGLRMEHTHCFAGEGAGKETRGGHYHFDLDDSQDEVEYEGWFNVAETLYRIDQPGAAGP
ncbi:hypothetical protein GQ53DRAFT_712165 [Thozetella sp. PMI_491]|nr:hypothetical protein GQ53DRAFT_712165 [Thozetella sp. PMI_491]